MTEAAFQPDADKSPIYTSVTEELKKLDHWVVWKKSDLTDSEYNRFKKVPFSPIDHKHFANHKDTSRCSTYERAISTLKNNDLGTYQGIGLFVTANDPYCFIDVDRCFDPNTKQLKPWGQALLDHFDSFSYVTASGTGLRILIEGYLADNVAKLNWDFQGESHKLEIYVQEWWITFCHDPEDVYLAKPIKECQDELDELFEEHNDTGSQQSNANASDFKPDTTSIAEPPVRLSEKQLRIWNGEAFSKHDETGEIDRSRSLYWLGHMLYEAGASCSTIVESLEERDETLGCNTYTDRKDSTEYLRIAHKVREKQESQSDNEGLGESIKLGDYMKGRIERPADLVEGIIPQGRVVQIFAPPGDGKSSLAFWITNEVIRQGKRVLFFDRENGPQMVGDALEYLSGNEGLVERLVDFRSDSTLEMTAKIKRNYENLLKAFSPDLVVFDSWVKFLSSAGLDENVSTDIAQWATNFIDPARKRGISVVILDHVVKGGTPKDSRGSGRKREEVDLQFHLKTSKTGQKITAMELLVRKDRENPIRPAIKFGTHPNDDILVLELKSSGKSGSKKVPTKKQQEVIDILKDEFDDSGAKYTEWVSKAAEFDVSKRTVDRTIESFIDIHFVKQDIMNKYIAKG